MHALYVVKILTILKKKTVSIIIETISSLMLVTNFRFQGLSKLPGAITIAQAQRLYHMYLRSSQALN